MRDCTIAGSPVKRQIISWLAAKAKALGEEVTPESIVLDRLAEGETLKSIAEDIGAELGIVFVPAVLQRWLCATPAGKAAYLEARKAASHVWADEAKQIADDVDEDRDAIAKARLQIDQRNLLASKYNRETFGNDAAQVNVQINMGQLHLDALRRRAVAVPVQQPLPPAGPDYETVTE